jgi:hypothetical protein
MRKHEFRGIALLDAQGILRTIYGCPEAQIVELRSLLDLIQREVDQADELATFTSLYRESMFFRQVCDRALSLNALDPRWFTLTMIREFVLPYERDGVFQPGLLEEISFPLEQGKAAKAARQITWEQRQASLVSALISTGLAHDFATAWATMERMSADELQILIEERVKAIDPKSEEKEAIADLIGECNADIKAGKPNPLLDMSGFNLSSMPIDFASLEAL